MVDSQIHRKTFWQYQLSAMWSHGDWAIEANANNLFLTKNNVVDELTATSYSFNQPKIPLAEQVQCILFDLRSLHYNAVMGILHEMCRHKRGDLGLLGESISTGLHSLMSCMLLYIVLLWEALM